MTRKALLSLAAIALIVCVTSIARAAHKAKLVGVVLPKDVRPGERASGSIVQYPAAIENLGSLEVKKASLEYDDNKPRKAVLSGFVIQSGDQKRPADQNFVVDVPAGANSVHVTISQNDQEVAQVDLPIDSSPSAPLTCGAGDWMAGTEADGTQSNFKMPAILCYAGMAVISGDFSGDAQSTRIEFGPDVARILGESRRFCYFLIPRTAGPGKRDVRLLEGSHQVTFHEVIPRLDLVQQLEEEGSDVASAPPPSGDAAGSDAPRPTLPFGLGVGIGGDSGGGSDFQIERQRRR